MAKKRTSKRSSVKRKSNNSAIVVILVVVIIALLSLFITHFIMNDNQEGRELASSTTENITETVAEKTVATEIPDAKVVSPIEGTWVSNNDGAMLTIVGKNFTIELPSVDSPQKTKGTINYNDNNITFLYSSAKNECGTKPGEYKYQISSDEIYFTVINDDCKVRAEQLGCGWFRL